MKAKRAGARRVACAAPALIGAALAVTGCDALPKDNYGTFERMRTSHVLRVGAAENPPLVSRAGGRFTGPEIALIEAFAGHHAARIEWSAGAQIELAERLHRRELDVLVAGLDDQAPLEKKVVLTRPYVETRGRDGSARRRVLAVMPGESRLLYELERFLLTAPAAQAAAREARNSP